MVQPNARCDGLPTLSAQLQFEPSRRNLTGPDAEPESLELSIVMPCLNEAETIAVCIQKAAFLSEAGRRQRRGGDRR